jgi:hypothetical protein
MIPTVLSYANRIGSPQHKERARKMLDWLLSIQFTNGAFQGGTVGANPKVPVTFNTGQILFGLVAGSIEFGEPYTGGARRAGDWLVETQDPDGCWRCSPSPFTKPGEKTYETHVSWALLEAEKVLPGRGYRDAALRNINWALSKQKPNGWFSDCCLSDSTQPLTHTIGYALRGILEGYRSSKDPAYLAAAQLTADGILDALNEHGWLPGRLDESWGGAVPWVCVTGSAQIAHCWILLYGITGTHRYLSGGRLANRFIRRTMVTQNAPPETQGAVKGSFPIDGGYCPYWYLNWASKFTIDSLMAELDWDHSEGIDPSTDVRDLA